ncbi:MAG TPA: plastocyanin/azurin family copper-binding protein [Gemmatimonadaceae bacterium]|nr:plastocyanin/azurin family copper-binding protein [Gemmatimonadaceae bacterium]
MRRISGLIAVLAVGFTTLSCGGGGDSTGTGGGGGGGGGGGTCPANTFCMTVANLFSPATLAVPVGTTVTWRNDAGTLHNVTWNNTAGRNAALAGDGTGDISDFSTGSHTRLFNTAGTFGFKCTIHPGMNGTLTVQ